MLLSNKSRRRALLLMFVLLAIGWSPASTNAQSAFNGRWSVLIITEVGDCDRAYRYGVRIERGQIFYMSEIGVTFTGRVDRNGRITVTATRGEQTASGSGRLSGSRGTGTWKGRSPTGAC